MGIELQNIIKKSGKKVTECKCEVCKKQCLTAPCLGTPADILKLIKAGFGDKIFSTCWAVGVLQGQMKDFIDMFQAEFIKGKGCVFYENELCALHSLSLKPTEGKLSHHSINNEDFDIKKNITYQVAKTWLMPENADIIKEIILLKADEKS